MLTEKAFFLQLIVNRWERWPYRGRLAAAAIGAAAGPDRDRPPTDHLGTEQVWGVCQSANVHFVAAGKLKVVLLPGNC
jgi:hypothetical protein